MINEQEGEVTQGKPNGVGYGRPWSDGMTSLTVIANGCSISPAGTMSKTGPKNLIVIQCGFITKQGHVISSLIYPLAVSGA